MNCTRKVFKALLGVGLIPLFLLTLGGNALSQTCVESPPGLVSWWPGDGNAQDIQGNNNGTLQGGTTFAPGMVGQAFSFDGIDDIVEVPDSPSLNIGIEDFSIVAWIRMNYTGNLQTIMDKRVFSDAHVELGYVFSAFPVGLCFQLANGSSYINYQSSASVQDGKFHHVAVTVRRSSSNGGKIFRDGAVVLVFNPTPYAGNLDNAANFRIGGHSLGYPSGGFHGLIDEMGFFKRALTDDEISMLYNEGSGCEIPRVPYSGDITNDGIVDLQDAISALKVAVGTSTYVNPLADVNGDNKIGIEEAIYALQCLAGLRNRTPELVSIGNKLVDEGSTLSFTFSASDPDGDVLNYTSSNLPAGATFNPDTKTFSWTPTYSQSGSYNVTITVTDKWGAFDSETITITVNDKVPVFVSTEYFPLAVGNWWDYIEDGTGEVTRTSVSGTKSIGGYTTYIMQYAEGDKEYYTSDSNGVKLYGLYVIDPDYTGDIFFNSPLLLIPNNAAVGSPEQVSSSSYPLTLYVDPYGYVTVTIDITTRTRLLAMEDVITQNRVLQDCIKASMQMTQVLRETGDTLGSETIYYWVYKGVGVVKQIDSVSSVTIKASYVNGVSNTY